MKKILLYILVLLVGNAFAQKAETIALDWKVQTAYDLGDVTLNIPQFQSEFFNFNVSERTIQFKKAFAIPALLKKEALQVSTITYQTISETDLLDLDKTKIPLSADVNFETSRARSTFKGLLVFNPIIKEKGVYKKVVSISYSINTTNVANRLSGNN